MANNNVVTVWVQLRANSDEAMAALKNLTSQTAESGKQFGGLGSAAASAFGKIGAVFKSFSIATAVVQGIGEVISLLKPFVTAAADAEAAQIKLTTSVERYGVKMSDVRPLIDGVRKELLDMGFETQKTDAAIASFQSRGATFTQSLDATRLAAKLATAEGGSLEDAVRQIGEAMAGQVPAGSALGDQLGNLRGQFEKIEDPSRRLQFLMDNTAVKIDAAAQKMGDSTVTKTRTFAAAWNEMVKNIGESVVSRWATAATDWLTGLIKGLNEAQAKIEAIKRGDVVAIKERELEQAKRNVQILKQGPTLESYSGPGYSVPTERARREAAYYASRIQPTGSPVLDDDQRKKAIEEAEAEVGRLEKQVADLRRKVEQRATTAAKDADKNTPPNLEAADGEKRRKEAAALADQKLQQSHNKSAAMELYAKADLARKVATDEAKLRQAKFDQDMATTARTLDERLKAVKTHYRDEQQIVEKTEAAIARMHADATDANIKRIASSLNEHLTSLPVDPNSIKSLLGPIVVLPGRIREVAQAAADSGVGVTDFIQSLKLGPNESKQFTAELEQLVMLLRKVKEEATAANLGKITLENQLRTNISEAFDAEIKKKSDDSKQITTRMQDKVQAIEIEKNAGNISASDAARQTLQVQAEAVEQLNQKLAEQLALQERIRNSPDLSASDRANKIKEVNNQLTDCQRKIEETKPSLEKQAAASDNVFLGMELGMQRVQSSMRSAAQMTAQTMDDLAKGMSHAFGVSFVGMIQGTKDFATSFRQMASDVLARIAEMLAEQALLNAIGSFGGGGSGGGGKQASGLMGILGGLFASTPKSAHGGYVGPDGHVTQSFSTGGVVASWNRGVMKSFAAGGYVGDPAAPLGLPRSADDRFLVAVRGGEGFIRPEAVDWLGGPNVIHAINRLTLPAPMMPRYSFAAGGVVPELARSAGGSGQPMVIRNVVAIGTEHLNRIASSSENQRAIRSYISDHPEVVESALNKRRRTG